MLDDGDGRGGDADAYANTYAYPHVHAKAGDRGNDSGACCSSACPDSQTGHHHDHCGTDNGSARSRNQTRHRDNGGARCSGAGRGSQDRRRRPPHRTAPAAVTPQLQPTPPPHDDHSTCGGAGHGSQICRRTTGAPTTAPRHRARSCAQSRSCGNDHGTGDGACRGSACRRCQLSRRNQARDGSADCSRLAKLASGQRKIQPSERHQRLRGLSQRCHRARQAAEPHRHQRVLRELSQEHCDVRRSPHEPCWNRGELRQLS